MKRSIVFFICLLNCIGLIVNASPFYFDCYDVYQPDSTQIRCEHFGDEFYSYLEDEDGFVIVLNTEDLYYYYAIHDSKALLSG